MDQSLKTSAIEDLNLASKILAETVPMTANDRIVLALVEHALVKLESKEVLKQELAPFLNLVKPWPVDVRGPMVRVPNLTEELKHGTKYRGVVHATEGQMHIFQITNRENQSEPAKYVLYSVEHGICSDWLHVSPEAAWADMDYFLRAVVSKVKKPENEKDSGQAEPDNLEHNKSETKSFVNLAMHLKLNKLNYVKDLVETATLNGETGRIYSVKVKNSGEEWFAVERLSDGESYLCNVMYRTKLGALDAFYAHAKNNVAQQSTEELPESSVTDETDTIEFTDLKKSLKLYSHAWKIIGTEEMDKPYKDRLIFTIKRVETEDLWYVGGESSDDGRKIELLNTIHKTKDRAVMAFYSQKGLKHPEESSTK